MKKLGMLILALVLTNMVVAQNKNDKKMIETAINFYFEGTRTDNPEIIKKAFHPDATLKYIHADGSYKMRPIREFFGFFKNSKKRIFTDKIYYIDVYGTAANVKLSTKYKTYQYIDYMNLLKTKDGWKIVSKISHRESFK